MCKCPEQRFNSLSGCLLHFIPLLCFSYVSPLYKIHSQKTRHLHTFVTERNHKDWSNIYAKVTATFTVDCPAVRLILFSQGVKLTTEQFNAIFTYYDKVGDISFKVVINNSWWQKCTSVQLLFMHCTVTWRVCFSILYKIWQLPL